jgi:hypothetical protein
MASKNYEQNLYGFPSPLTKQLNPPIISQRAPNTRDFAPFGQIWIDQPNNDAYVLTSIVSNVASWVGIGGGAGDFTNIIASGTILAGGSIGSTTGNITAFSGNIVATLGNVSAGGSVTAGTSLNGATVTSNGQITSTTGNLVASAAGQGVILGGGAKVVCGAGDPNAVVSAPQGSLYLNLTGSGVANRLWINSDGDEAWVAISTVS